MTPSGSPSLSLVIPLFNEEHTVHDTHGQVSAELEKTGEPWELIFVDDGSRDGTWEKLQELARADKRLRAVRLTRNFGKESALSAGLEQTRGQAVIVMDGDLQHPPALLPKMVQLWKTGEYDIVEAWKVHRGAEPLRNRLGARIFYGLMEKLTGYELSGATDFKLMDRRVVNAWLQLGERTLFFRGMVAWLGFRKKRLAFKVPGRARGESRWTLRKLSALGLDAITAFTSMPLILVNLFGVFFLLLAFAIGGTAIVRLLTGTAVSGFTTVILMQCIIGSLLMIGLGIIGQYIARIYDEVKGRPRYLIAETTDQKR